MTRGEQAGLENVCRTEEQRQDWAAETDDLTNEWRQKADINIK